MKRKSTATHSRPRKPRPRARSKINVGRGSALSGPSHVTPAGGNIFADLGFAPADAENLKLRAHLMNELRDVIDGMTQVQAAQFLGVSQPRVSDLSRGKIGLFTIDALVNMLGHAGVTLDVSLKKRRNGKR